MRGPDHSRVLACPVCRKKLEDGDSGVHCSACGAHFRRRHGFLDFAPDIPLSSIEQQPGAAQRYMEDPEFIDQYIRSKRAFFVKTMGKAWGCRFGGEDENRYIREFVPRSQGPVLDLACGPGCATRYLVDSLGVENVIGLDLSFPMLKAARKVLPSVHLIRGSALQMPIHTAGLGAILCWNSLQLFPDPERVIAEVGRCLRPGGTFVCFTYRRATGPYRIVQKGWERLIRGVEAFEEEKVRRWLGQAGLAIRDLRGPRLILRFSACKL